MKVQNITANTTHATAERFRGFSVRESAGAAAVATVNFRSGSVSGQILWTLELAADESAGIVLPDQLLTSGGVYVQVVAGTITGVLFHD